MLPKPAKRGRPPTDRRRIVDAILYVVKCGCPWRYLPTDFPPWQTVYHVIRQWTRHHLWAALNDALRTLVRKAQGKRARPTAAILDSQSVKSDGHGGPVGYDAGKRIKGRTAMQDQVNRERRAMEKNWKEREKQIERVIKNTVGLYGDMQGIIGGAIPQIQALELGGGGVKKLSAGPEADSEEDETS